MMGNHIQNREHTKDQIFWSDSDELSASPSAPGAACDASALRDLLLRFVLAAFCWLGILAIGASLDAGYLSRLVARTRFYVPFVLMLLATMVVFYCGFPILRTAILGLRHGLSRMEFLIGLSALATYLFSMVQTLRGATPVFFDTASMIIVFFLACELVERSAKAKTWRWVAWLRHTVPTKVRLVTNGREHVVGIDALTLGKSFVVKIGEPFSADGIVETGESHVDESLLTGDSAPVPKCSGDTIFAGTINLDGELFVKATSLGSHTTLSRIISAVERALCTPSPLRCHVDRAIRLLVPAVALLATATFWFCWLRGYTILASAMLRAITVLLIASPWALKLATPFAITAAVGAASRRGILISDTRILETFGRVNHVVLDKTGVMTKGQLHLLGCELVPDLCSSPAWMQANAANSDLDPLPTDLPFDFIPPSYEQTFSLLASLEQYSEHPLGRAIVAFARERNIPLGEPTCVELHGGRGITGIVDGKSLFLGGRRLSDDMAIFIDARSELIARRWESEGRTVTFFGWDGALQGCLAFGDSLRNYAFAMVAELKRRGIEPHLVSGDSQGTTEALALQLGLESFRFDVLPSQKARIVREWRKSGAVVAMVGDGIHDAPALADADLSIALNSGAHIALSGSSVVLMDSDLSKIPELFDLLRKAMRIIRQNLVWALLFNAVGLALAVTGQLNPLSAAMATLLSGLVVVGNSLRLNPTLPPLDQ
jgi:heavy metal translocating P-type ATPase